MHSFTLVLLDFKLVPKTNFMYVPFSIINGFRFDTDYLVGKFYVLYFNILICTYLSFYFNILMDLSLYVLCRYH